jgi:hypothetical protein
MKLIRYTIDSLQRRKITQSSTSINVVHKRQRSNRLQQIIHPRTKATIRFHFSNMDDGWRLGRALYVGVVYVSVIHKWKIPWKNDICLRSAQSLQSTCCSGLLIENAHNSTRGKALHPLAAATRALLVQMSRKMQWPALAAAPLENMKQVPNFERASESHVGTGQVRGWTKIK